MAFTAPRTWVAGEIVTAALMNTHIRDNLRYLKGLDGVTTIESGLTIDNTGGDERLLLPLLSTAECSTVLNAEGEVAFDETTHQMKEYDGTAVRAVISEADVDDTPVNGATTVPVSSNWAYDFINTLSTQADLPYATAAGVWTRLAKGAQGQFLHMNVGATAPEWVASSLNVIVKNHNRALDGGSGDVGYTGYGFTPKALIFFAGIGVLSAATTSVGFDDGTTHECINGNGVTTSYSIYNVDTTGQEAIVKTLDADGFTLTWTKVGAPGAGTISLYVLALG